MINGICPIIATPFREDGQVDEESFRRIVRYVLRAGAHGVVFPAVASEFYALSEGERKRFSEVMIDEVHGSVPVIVGTSASSTAIAVDLSRHAEKIGADAVMLMAPYVVKERSTVIQEHFGKVAEAVDLPIIMQNSPAFLGSAQSTEDVLQLLNQLPQIRYVKEENLPCGQRITRLLGEAPTSLLGVFGGAGGRYLIDEINRGAIGAMPACELTEIHTAIFNHFAKGDRAGARNLYNRSLPLLNLQAVFRMSMTKAVLYHRGIIEDTRVRAGGILLDEFDQNELKLMLGEVEDLLLPETT